MAQNPPCSIFIPNWCSLLENPFMDSPQIDAGNLIRDKDQAIKAVVFLMSEWKIIPQDFVDQLKR